MFIGKMQDLTNFFIYFDKIFSQVQTLYLMQMMISSWQILAYPNS